MLLFSLSQRLRPLLSLFSLEMALKDIILAVVAISSPVLAQQGAWMQCKFNSSLSRKPQLLTIIQVVGFNTRVRLNAFQDMHALIATIITANACPSRLKIMEAVPPRLLPSMAIQQIQLFPVVSPQLQLGILSQASLCMQIHTTHLRFPRQLYHPSLEPWRLQLPTLPMYQHLSGCEFHTAQSRDVLI
jgi:hypothetical protein